MESFNKQLLAHGTWIAPESKDRHTLLFALKELMIYWGMRTTENEDDFSVC